MSQLRSWVLLTVFGFGGYTLAMYGPVAREYWQIRSELTDAAPYCSKLQNYDCLRAAKSRASMLLGFEPTIQMGISDSGVATLTCDYDRPVSYFGKRVYNAHLVVTGRYDRSLSGSSSPAP